MSDWTSSYTEAAVGQHPPRTRRSGSHRLRARAPWRDRIPYAETVVWASRRRDSMISQRIRGPLACMVLGAIWAMVFATNHTDIEIPVALMLGGFVWLCARTLAIRYSPHAERYLLTDKAAYIATGPLHRAKIARFALPPSTDPDALPPHDSRTVQIGTRAPAAHHLRHSKDHGYDAEPVCFHDIPDAATVSDLIRQIRNGQNQIGIR